MNLLRKGNEIYLDFYIFCCVFFGVWKVMDMYDIDYILIVELIKFEEGNFNWV